MNATENVRVYGVLFTYTVSTPPSEGGVIVPLDTDLNNPMFLDALDGAMQVYPEWVNIQEIKTILSEAQTKDLTVWQNDSVNEFLKQIIRAFEQTSYPLDESDLERFQAMRERLEYELSRRTNAATATELARKRAWMKKSGYVYLIESSHGVYKIGLSRDPQNRIATFGILLPFPVEFVCLIQTDDMRALETQLHTRYADKRINGEWFALDTADVEYIKSLAVVQS